MDRRMFGRAVSKPNQSPQMAAESMEIPYATQISLSAKRREACTMALSCRSSFHMRYRDTMTGLCGGILKTK